MSDDDQRRWPHQRAGGALARGVVAALGLAPMYAVLATDEGAAALLPVFVAAVLVGSSAFLTEHRGRAGAEVWARLAIAGAIGAVLSIGATLWLQHLGDPLGAWRDVAAHPDRLAGEALAGSAVATVVILALSPWFHARASTVALGPQVAGGLCVAVLVATPWLSHGALRRAPIVDALAALASGALVPLLVALSERPGRFVARLDPMATTPVEVDPRRAMLVSLTPLVVALLLAPVALRAERGRLHPSALARTILRELPRGRPEQGAYDSFIRAAVVIDGHLVRFVDDADGDPWIGALDSLASGASYVSNGTGRTVALDRPVALDVVGFALPADD